MRMYGVFLKPKMPDKVEHLNGTEVVDEKAWQAAVAESDKNPVALCRYADGAQKIVKEYTEGQMEIREVEVPTFEVVTRRVVQL